MSELATNQVCHRDRDKQLPGQSHVSAFQRWPAPVGIISDEDLVELVRATDGRDRGWGVVRVAMEIRWTLSGRRCWVLLNAWLPRVRHSAGRTGRIAGAV
jgi:hypothetical protein